MSFASGKVILLGEHAVVYGQPALAGALDAGVHVSCSPSETLRLIVPAWGVDFPRGDRSVPLGAAFSALVDALDGIAALRVPTLALSARFNLPTGAGLGSSAALSVAIVRALAAAAGRAISHEEVCAAAMAAETVFHGKPSGIDHAVSAQGGFGLFTRKAGLRPVNALREVSLVVGHTGRERDTKGRVCRVAELSSERPEELQRRFEAIGAIVRRGTDAVERGSDAELGAAMNENQEHLRALEVSCPEIETLCALARDGGALGAKLTGGGGGGCVIALAPGREDDVQRAWAAAGFTSFLTSVGGAAGRARGTVSGAQGSEEGRGQSSILVAGRADGRVGGGADVVAIAGPSARRTGP